jgi:hypothetical protein
MSVKDIKSQLQSNVAFFGTIASNTTTNGSIIDNANYDLGIMFVVQCTNYTDGTYSFTIDEGDDASLSDATTVPAEKIIGNLSSLDISAANVAGDSLNSVGVFSNKRYLRLNVVSTGTTTGATINAIVEQSAEVVPV